MSDHDSNDNNESDTNESTPDTELTGRSAMHEQATTPRRGPTRRLVVGTAVVGAMALLASAAAWACTLREGTKLNVYLDGSYASCVAAGEFCSKGDNNGTTVGLASVDNDAEQVLRITGTGFVNSTDQVYAITWRKTTNTTGNCHRTNLDGSIVLMGTAAVLNASGDMDTTETAVVEGETGGLAKLCVQDYEFGGTSTASATPTVVVGQIVDIGVADLL